MLERANQTTTPIERERAAQCSGSLGEEQFVLTRYFGGGGAADAATRGGTYFELGAFDGWKESNTLHLEECLGWSGVLMDGQPAHLGWMRANRPASVSLGLAVCPEHGLVNYSSQRATTAGILPYMKGSVRQRFKVDGAGVEAAPCGPLGPWLALLGMRHVDFFSLDVQGAGASLGVVSAPHICRLNRPVRSRLTTPTSVRLRCSCCLPRHSELMVLQTIDWSRLTVGVLLSECKGIGCRDAQDEAVCELLERSAGMKWAGMLRARHDVWDAIFVNRTLWLRTHGDGGLLL